MYTIWIMVESDDPSADEKSDIAWWFVDTQPNKDDAILTAAEIASKLNEYFGFTVERLDEDC